MMSSPAPVPDILLSQAKDDRYISQVSSLLSQIASVCVFPLCPDGRRNNNSSSSRSSSGAQSTTATTTTATSSTPNQYGGSDYDCEDDDHEQHHFIHRIFPELNLLASIIVHSSAFIYHNRAPKNESRSTLGMESLNLVYQKSAKKSKQEIPFSSKSSSIIQSFWNVNHFQMMVVLQTIVPYMLQRVSRGGWNEDIRALIPARSEGIIHGIGGDERALRNDDNLRGSARRRLFDQQRRQMLQLSSASTRNANNDNHDDSEVENENANPSIATLNSSDTDQSATVISPIRNANDRRLTKKIATLCWDALKKIALATSSLSHGAHSLPSRHDSSTAATNDSLDRTTKVIKWFLRLHLALFYWNGWYPTVLHRLTGGIIASDQMSGETVIANRPTYKPVAAIILFQASTALARATAEASIELAHFVQIAFFRWRLTSRRRQWEQQQSSGECRATQSTANSERAEYMDLIEEHVPGIGSTNNASSSKLCPTMSKTKDPIQYTTGPTTTAGLPCCGICLNERVHPSVPSVCGHVFCWSCILHWVSNVRAECPLCRAETRRQDIIPLYNYP